MPRPPKDKLQYSYLTKEDKENLIKQRYDKSNKYEENIAILVKKYGVAERNIRIWVENAKQELGIKQTPKTIEDTDSFKQAQKRIHKKSQYYIITWCQNETPINKAFWDNIIAYKDFLKAELLVIAGRYKNPTSVFQDGQREHWDSNVLPYLDANRHDIHKQLTILSDVKTQPTASNPLVGFESITREQSCILGHPKMHLKAVPVMKGYTHKIILTTGAVSEKNYTDSKAGKKGDFHHHLGFVIVEIRDEEIFYTRQVQANTSDGSFSDLFFEIKDKKVRPITQAKGLVLGDIHTSYIDKEVLKATYKLTDSIFFQNIALHDVFNCDYVSHHNDKNPFKKIQMIQDGKFSLEKELRDTYNFLDDFDKKTPYSMKYIVYSNHNEHLDKYVQQSKWKDDLFNAPKYFELANIIIKERPENGLFAYLVEKNVMGSYKCLAIDEKTKFGVWEISQHGHVGVNGSKGTPTQFSKLNTKNITGHTHSPFRHDGHIGVGTSTVMDMGYNKGGFSSWLNAHAIVHNDDKAQHIIIIKGDFTTMWNLIKTKK